MTKRIAKSHSGLLISVSMGAGTAIGVAEKNVPAGILFAAAFSIIFGLLIPAIKHTK